MEHWQDRTRLLIGDEGIEILRSKHVLVVGLGGVGAYAAEQLARAGIGRMTIVDGDVVNVTNRIASLRLFFRDYLLDACFLRETRYIPRMASASPDRPNTGNIQLP